MQIFIVYIALILCLFESIWAGLDTAFNLTHFKAHREKRTLIFEGGGTMKLVLGPALPIPLEDPIVWRSLVGSITLQGGHYSLPTTPLYPWDKYEDIFARSMRKISSSRSNKKLKHHGRRLQDAAAALYWNDDSRLFVYTALESFLNRRNVSSGRVCLLRSICENAQVQQHVGVFAEVLNIVLTPGKENIDTVYKEALEAGKNGVDCLKLYEDCPMGSNILDSYLEFL